MSPVPSTPSFCPLASGSAGNALLFCGPDGPWLLDAGLHRAELVQRLQRVGVRPEALRGIVLTHRHKDHVRAAGQMSRRFRVEVFAGERTAEHLLPRMLFGWQCVHAGVPFEVAGWKLEAFRVEHDAPETLGYRAECNGFAVGVATDLGSLGGGIDDGLRNCDVVYLEFNHDRRMLREGPYEESLKRRIAGPQGHLSNEQAATLLARIAGPRLKRVYLAHLSAHNNTEALATSAAHAALTKAGCSQVEVVIAQQDRPSEAFAATPAATGHTL